MAIQTSPHTEPRQTPVSSEMDSTPGDPHLRGQHSEDAVLANPLGQQKNSENRYAHANDTSETPSPASTPASSITGNTNAHLPSNDDQGIAPR